MARGRAWNMAWMLTWAMAFGSWIFPIDAARLSNACAADGPLAEAWDYGPAMREVTARFKGEPGVVLHVGDSLTYSNPYGQWARNGAEKTPEDVATLKWMHLGKEDRRDGWWLARFDHPDGGRSHSACSGLRMDELLAGGKRGLPSLEKLLDDYRPQVVVLLCGTNDATERREPKDFLADARRAIDMILAKGAMGIVTTIPPHYREEGRAREYNVGLRQIAQDRKSPLIDLEREIVSRRPDDWNGSLLSRDDVHLSAGSPPVTSASAPTDENLRECGYLLRGWLTVRKLVEVKSRAIDGVTPMASSPVRVTTRRSAPVARPLGKPVRLPVTRDTRLSSYPGEELFAPGGASQIKLKSNQEMGLVDFDAASLRGQVVTGGELHVRLPTGWKEPLRRVSLAAVAGPWWEGNNGSSTPADGATSFAWRRNKDLPWAGPGSDLTAAVFGATGGQWSSAEASEPDGEGWQVIPVDARVITARVAGLCEGLLVFDDTGSEWTRDGEKVAMRDFPNRHFWSRDAGRDKAPYFVVYVDGDDRQPPKPPQALAARLAAGRRRDVVVSWQSPAWSVASEAVGFRMWLDDKEVPNSLVPAAPKMEATGDSPTEASSGKAKSQTVKCLLRESELNEARRLRVTAVDGAGNESTPVEVELPARPTLTPLDLPPAPMPFAAEGELPTLGSARIAVIDTLDKLHPLTGKLIEPAASGLTGNHLWSAKTRTIRLHAARGELVSFQVAVLDAARGVRPSLRWETPLEAEVGFARARHVATKVGPQPDPLVPLDERGISVPDPDDRLAEQTCGSLHVELLVPKSAKAGNYRGTLTLASGDDRLELTVTLEVWPFVLPDELRFLPEMNCYGLPDNEMDYYRLAHRHRTVLNRLPYHQNGSVAPGAAPKWDGKTLDFREWDRRFAPLLDGTAFADLPRAGAPVECFYLPLHENWPTPIDKHYNGSYWADEAFTPEYRMAFVEATRQFTRHIDERGWRATRFHGFLNNKVMYKAKGWSRGSAPWLLDEPSHFQDYWALRYFGLAFHDGVELARRDVARRDGQRVAAMCYRCDISRPQWQRGTLDGLLDYNVVSSGAFQAYRPLVLARKELSPHEVVVYGGANDPATANVQSAAWCVDAWTQGADGVVPWQTIGNEQSWKQGEPTALFYPGKPAGIAGPVPSVRLKGFLRGQQDVEYLMTFAEKLGMTQRELGESLRRLLPLSGERRGTGFVGDEDAGVMDYGRLTPLDLWTLRMRVAQGIVRSR